MCDGTTHEFRTDWHGVILGCLFGFVVGAIATAVVTLKTWMAFVSIFVNESVQTDYIEPPQYGLLLKTDLLIELHKRGIAMNEREAKTAMCQQLTVWDANIRNAARMPRVRRK